MRERARMKRLEGCSDERNEADRSVAPDDDCNSVMGKGGHVNFFSANRGWRWSCQHQ